MIQWQNYKDFIQKRATIGQSSSEILNALKETFPDVKWNSSSDRHVRHIVYKMKEAGDIVNKSVNLPRVLLFDIETAAMLLRGWDKWNPPISVVKDWYIICWSAKWMWETRTYNACVTPEEAINRDDERVVKALWGLLNEADVVIAHNGDKFDIKKVNSRFFFHRLGPTNPFQSIDTLKATKKVMKNSSNRLDDLLKMLNKEGKYETPRGLWEGCEEGDPESLKIMQHYCDEDIRGLEDYYLELRPWIKPHPNIGLMMGQEEGCAYCGEDDGFTPAGYVNTYVSTFEVHKCNNCGGLNKTRKSMKDKNSLRSL
jgi:uncharacterized protein YprB with RNaseH-like and TPR domain